MQDLSNPFSCEVKELFLKDPFGISRGTRKSVRNLFIRIGDGWGEGSPVYYKGQTVEEMEVLANDFLSTHLNNKLGIDEVVFQFMEIHHHQSALIQAIDLALHDSWGKQIGKPLYKIWEFSFRNAPLTSFTIGMDQKEIVLEKVRKASTYPILKIKAGGENDLPILEAIRKENDKPMLIDANEGWTEKETLEYLPNLKKLGVLLVEQPLPGENFAGYKRIREQNQSGIPIFVDEAVQGPEDVESWAGIVQGINVKLAKCGGFLRARETIAKAREHGMQVMLGCMIQSSLGITAAAHLAPLVDYADLDGAALLANDPFVGMKLEKGRIIMPDKPGIGASIAF